MCGESIKFVCIILSARDLQSQDFSLDILGIISLVVSAILHWLIAKDKLKKYVEKDHTDLNKSDMYKWQHGNILRINTFI